MSSEMQHIQWFPGHMTKTRRKIAEVLPIIDAVAEIVDARIPVSSRNPDLKDIIKDKPLMILLNKCDMADDAKTRMWKEYFTSEKSICVELNSTASSSSKVIEKAMTTLLKAKIDKNKSKGISLILRDMILGVPNSGKSTLANNLCGKARAVTGNKPGVTKNKQWVRLGNMIEVLDTPGTLWPAFDNNQVAKHLAYIGSIKEEILDVPELSLDLISDLSKLDKNILVNRYQIEIEEEDEPLILLEKICESRKFLLKKNEIDYDRGAYAIVNEFKNGKLGKITLETPKDIKRLSIKDRKKLMENNTEID